MLRRTALAITAIMVLVSSCSVAVAQAQGNELAGRVVDSTGAVVPGATVVLRRTAVGLQMSTVTDAAGNFRFSNLAPAPYEMTVRAPGFAVRTIAVAVAPDMPAVEVRVHPGALAEEVTVEARHLAGTEETAARIPGAVEVLGPEALEASRVFNFSEALRKVAGVNVRDEEGLGLRPNIGIRGLNPTRSTKVLLLEDGIPLTYAPYGDNASYYHPPVERFESIEVLKGAGQILYGPVTVGGVVNYVTPEPPQKTAGSFLLAGGSRDYWSGMGSIGTRWRNTGARLDYMHKQASGARENIFTRLDDVNLKTSTSLGERHTLVFRGNYFRENSNNTYSGLRQDEFEANPRQNPFRNDFFYGDRAGASATHTYALNEQALVTTNVYGTVFSRRWWRQSSNSGQRPNDASDAACGGMQNLNTTCGNEGRLRRYYTFGIDPHLRLRHGAFGMSHESDFGVRYHFEDQNRAQKNGPLPTSRDGVLVENNARKNHAFSFFAQNRFVRGALAVTPGLRVEHVRYFRLNRLGNAGSGVSGDTQLTQLVPGVGVSYAVREGTTVFAGVHRGFAPPRTEDIISNTTGGVIELDPELSWNYEVGARTLPFRGIRLDATYFRMDYENQIVPASLAGGVGAALTNGGQTLHQGLEATAQVDTGTMTGSPHNFYLRAAYTYLPVAEFRGQRFSSVSGSGAVSVTGNRLPYAPRHLLNASAGYMHASGIHAMLEAVRVGEQFGDDLNTIAPTADGQRGLIAGNTTWNTAVNYRIEPWRATVFVAMKNVLNDTFIVDRSRGILVNHGRLVQTGVKYTF